MPNPPNTPQQKTENDHIAAIDIGSNSFHLITARVEDGAIQPLVIDKQMVRLASGLDEQNTLSEDAMLRGLDVLRSFALSIKDIDVDSVRVVATHTLRRAHNADDFVRRARQFMPAPVEVISGDEEARLIYQGVAHHTHYEGPRLVIDIGGGSTEFAVGEGFSVRELSSQPMGCVTFTKRFFPDGTMSSEAFDAASLAARQRLEAISSRFIDAGWDKALGASGTIKAVNQYLSAESAEDNTGITRKALLKMRKELINIGETKKLSSVDEHRRNVLPAGLAILIAIFEEFAIDSLTVSGAALREGVLSELIDRMDHQDIRERTIESLMTRYSVDPHQVERVWRGAQQLFNSLSEQLPRNEKEIAANFLRWGISVHEIGLQINRRGIQKHSAYIVQNAPLPGFSNQDQALLGAIVDAHRKRFQRADFEQYDVLRLDTMIRVIAILRLSILMNVRRLDNFLPDIQASYTTNTLTLAFPKNWLSNNALVVADLKTEAQQLAQNGLILNWE